MKYVDMLDNVLGDVVGCPEGTAAMAMRAACIAWCEKTYCLTNPALIVSEPAADEPQTIDLGALWPFAIIDARIAGVSIAVLAQNEDEVADATDEEPVIVYSDPSSPMLVPAPARAVTVELLLAVHPGQESQEVPDVVWQRYREHLEHGALGRLFMRLNKPWTNLALGENYLSRFEAAAAKEAAALGRNRVQRAQQHRVRPA